MTELVKKIAGRLELPKSGSLAGGLFCVGGALVVLGLMMIYEPLGPISIGLLTVAVSIGLMRIGR